MAATATAPVTQRMRNDQFKVTVSITGVTMDTDPWDTTTGGDTDSTETKYRPGGMAPEVSLGGSVSVANLVLTRNFMAGRDDTLIADLRSAAGKKPASVTIQPLDGDGNPFGTGETFKGILQRVRGPQPDSMSQDAAMIEMEIAPGATVS
jgi:hypothetical protein